MPEDTARTCSNRPQIDSTKGRRRSDDQLPAGVDRAGLVMPPGALLAPTLRITSTRDGYFDALLSWRGELAMAYADGDDTPEVLVGYVEFLTIRTGEDAIAGLLDSLPTGVAHFGALFDGNRINPVVQEQFRHGPPINQVLLVTTVVTAEPLRGHGLGALLVAEVLTRIATATDTLVLTDPVAALDDTGVAAEAEAIDTLSGYWQRLGLVRLDADHRFLGQTTGFMSMARARRALRVILEGGAVAVPALRLRERASWLEPRYTLLQERDSAVAAGP